jgi:hypothetical protein
MAATNHHWWGHMNAMHGDAGKGWCAQGKERSVGRQLGAKQDRATGNAFLRRLGNGTKFPPNTEKTQQLIY